MDLLESGGTGALRHPWETARLDVFADILDEYGATRALHRVLDVGAGDAWFSSQLLERLPADAHIDCVDSGYGALPPRADASGRLAFHKIVPPGRYDAVILLDVLEHVEDDRGFLSQLVADALAPGGFLLISVPAWQLLYTAHDRALRHHRRYSPGQARSLLESLDLPILGAGGLFHTLLLPRGVSRVIEAVRSPRVDEPASTWKHGPRLTAVVSAALALDNRLSRMAARMGLDVPGLSWWALCRK